MKILLINNGTKHLKELLSLLKEVGEIVIRGNLDYQDVSQNFDLVVLSGGHNCSVVNHGGYYQKEIEFLRGSKIPVLGICLGAELIAYAFGAKLKHLHERERGVTDVEVLKPDAIFDGILSFKVYESHQWAVTQMSGDLMGLARSKDGFEVFKHKNRPLYGFQFHPELFEEQTVGARIFRNLLNFLSIKV